MFGLNCTRLPANFSLHFSALLKTVFVVIFVGALQAATAPASSASPPSDSASTPSDITPLALPIGTDTPTHDATVGTLTGQAGVDGGAATYTVSLMVPPGRAGMQPSLSLNYNGRNGNGVMGEGWTMSGTSSIHRCPQTVEQDGQTLGVSYTANDKLCLDGQRLVATSGTYGAANTQYRTEVDSYARITQIGGGLTGNATCFRVEQKDGRLLDYGAVLSTPPLTCGTSTSRVLPNGAAGSLSWMREKIQDRVGNNQIYTYHDYSAGYGEILLQQIAYTGSSGVTGNRTVTFAYAPRTTAASGALDAASRFLAGGLTMQTQALQSITTAVAGVTARVYQPHYVLAAYSQRLLMSSLQECAGSGCTPSQTTCVTSATQACHPATAFTYNDSALQYPLTSLAGVLPNGAVVSDPTVTATPNQVSMIGDLDGDGTKEAAGTVTMADGTHVYLMQMTADRVAHAAVDLTGTGFGGADIDVDGDGRSEQMQTPLSAAADQHISFNAWKLGRGVAATASSTPALSFAALFTNYPSNIPYPYGAAVAHGQNQIVFEADLDGDGKPDVLLVSPTTSGCGAADVIGPQDGVFFYKNVTLPGPLSATNPPKFTIPTAPLFCLTRTVNPLVTGATIQTYHELAIDHIADFDGNGLPDFYLTYGGDDNALAGGATSFAGVELTQQVSGVLTMSQIQPLTCDTTTNSATDDCSGINGYITHWMDINGDGLEDFVIARPYQGTWHVRLNQGNGTLGAEINTGSTNGLQTFAAGATGFTFRYATQLPTMDVDGDGKPDILVPSNTQGMNGFAVKMCTIRHVNPITNGDGTNCPAALGAKAALPGTIPPATSALQCAAYVCPENVDSDTLTLPVNSQAQGYDYQWKNLPAFGAYDTNAEHGGALAADNSVYHLAMVKFVQTGPTTLTTHLVETPLISQLNGYPHNNQDLFGDGLADLTTTVGCVNMQQSFTNGGTTVLYNACSVVGDGTYGPNALLPDGSPPCTTQPDGSCYFDTHPILYANINQGTAGTGGSLALAMPTIPTPALPQVTVAATGTPLLPLPVLPGLLWEAQNGLGDLAAWVNTPLSVPGSQGDVPLYRIPSANGYVDTRHYYFTSSMPVVSGFVQSTGVNNTDGSANLNGFRSTTYGYAQAMYNHLGRGFQGFHTIIAETGKNVPADQTRIVRTTTTYNQKFPLAGKVATVQVRVPQLTLPAGGETAETLMHQETDTWACTRATRAACAQGDTLVAPTGTTVLRPFLDNQVVADYDMLTGAQMSEVDTVNAATPASITSGWDNGSDASPFGNLTNQVVTRKDVGTPLFVTSHTVSTTNTFAAADVTNWWINQLLNTSITSSMVYNSTHTLPTGATAPSQTNTTGMTWNTDRTLKTKTLQSGISNQQSTATYTYPTPSFGLPIEVSINAPDLDAAHSATRNTTYVYTKDGTTAVSTTSTDGGYFVLTTANPKSQITTTDHEVTDGQVTTVIDPNNVKTTTTYDVFGRPTRMDYLNTSGASYASSTVMALNSCSAGTCAGGGIGEDGNEATAAYRMTTSRTGYPTQVTWYDLLGRTIKHAERSFDGTLIETLSEYDAYNTVEFQSLPFLNGGTTYLNGATYDRLNRPVQKIGQGAQMDALGNQVTDYRYNGRTTSITVHPTGIVPNPTTGACPAPGSNPVNLCMNMSRSMNVLGQWMQTVDAAGSATHFWTEPLGHVAAIADAESNITYATYNALGQRTQSIDPDQGTWSFTYDAFSERMTQTDARGLVTTVNTRDALGRTTEQQQVPPSVVPTGMANETLLDDWVYDTATGGVGQLTSVVRKRGTNRTTPSSNPIVWQETYGYETATARPSTIATVVSEPNAVTMSSSMNYDADGRANTHTYPSGLVVANVYTTYGQLQSLTNNGSTTYWTATAENEWGHVTGETFTGGISGTHADFDSTGQAQNLSWTGGVADQMVYGYDSFGNVVQQQRTASGANNTEQYLYDPLQRLTQASRALNGNPVQYAYSASGNLTYKNDYSIQTASAYTYGTAVGTGGACGPHAATSVELPGGQFATYNCDANGNVVGGNTLTAVYDADNHPTTITRTFASVPIETCRKGDTIFCDGFEHLAVTSGGSGSATWAYDSNGQRDYETSSQQGTRYYGPNGYELLSTGVSKHELGPVIVSRTGTTDSITVVLRDRMGSTLDTIDGSTVVQRSYDAFGKTRNGDMSDRPNGTLNLEPDTIHGFTSHTHEDDVALIHMNGRVYDYTLARFLNVDPVIGNPMNSQSLNPYSYIGNNPLAGRDPTGYTACSEVSSNQTDSSGSCDITGANGKTTSISYAFNASGDLGVSRSASAASAAVSVGVLAGNGSDAMGPTGPSSKPNSGAASDIGAMAQTVGQQATNAVRNLFPENAALSDQAGSGQQYSNDVGGAALGIYNSLARAANGVDQMGWLGMTQGQYAGPGDMFPTFPVSPEMQRGAAFGEGATFLATMFAGPERLGVDAAGEWAGIGSTGKVGEDALKAMGGEPQQYFRTPMGGRFIDQLINGVGNEAKVGYQTLTRGNALQIQKDAWLIRNDPDMKAAAWHFYESPVTGRSGPSAPLRDALQQSGIDIFEH